MSQYEETEKLSRRDELHLMYVSEDLAELPLDHKLLYGRALCMIDVISKHAVDLVDERLPQDPNHQFTHDDVSRIVLWAARAAVRGAQGYGVYSSDLLPRVMSVFTDDPEGGLSEPFEPQPILGDSRMTEE